MLACTRARTHTYTHVHMHTHRERERKRERDREGVRERGRRDRETEREKIPIKEISALFLRQFFSAIWIFNFLPECMKSEACDVYVSHLHTMNVHWLFLRPVRVASHPYFFPCDLFHKSGSSENPHLL